MVYDSAMVLKMSDLHGSVMDNEPSVNGKSNICSNWKKKKSHVNRSQQNA